MAAGNRKSSNKRKTQTKKERMAEIEKAQAFRVEVTLWIVVAAALLLFIRDSEEPLAKPSAAFFLVCSDLWHMFFRCCFLWAVFLRYRTVEISWQP